MSPQKPVLSDVDWDVLKAGLDHVRSTRRRPMKNERQTVEAVLWRFASRSPWRDIPAHLGPWTRAAHLHNRWVRLGVWARLRDHLKGTPQVRLVELVLLT